MTYWYVDSCVARDSRKVNHTTCYHIELINVETRERRCTYIETSFKNYRNWRDVIHTHPQGQIITNVNSIGKKLIDADSKPQQVFVTDQNEMKDMLNEKWKNLSK